MALLFVIILFLFTVFLVYRQFMIPKRKAVLLRILTESNADSVICFKNISFCSYKYLLISWRYKDIYLSKNTIMIVDDRNKNKPVEDDENDADYLLLRKGSKAEIDENLFSHFGYIDDIIFKPDGKIKIKSEIYAKFFWKRIGYNTISSATTITLNAPPVLANQIKEKLQLMQIIKTT